jgi:hypothetical protein
MIDLVAKILKHIGTENQIIVDKVYQVEFQIAVLG